VPVSWKWHWGILLGVMIVGGIDKPYQSFPGIWNNVIVYIIYGQWLAYLVLSGILLAPVIRSMVKAAGVQTTKKFWLLVYTGNCIVFIVYLLALFRVVRGIYITGAISFSFFLYLTIFFYLYSTNMGNLLQVQNTTPPDKPEKKKIAETDAQTWIEKLEKIFSEKELYKDPNLKLNDLAQKINISPHLLSQLLNDNLGKSFSTYINEYRINEACKLITTNDLLTFEAIGYEVGFNSKSTFYTAFKKIKDTTPALFKESIEKIDHK
jgi:AraC-like DNA-binding protein